MTAGSAEEQAADKAPNRRRGCAGCAERDARVAQLGDELAEAVTAMQARTFAWIGIVGGAAIAAIALAAIAIARTLGGDG